jgi:hypothetical protein
MMTQGKEMGMVLEMEVGRVGMAQETAQVTVVVDQEMEAVPVPVPKGMENKIEIRY